MEAKDTQAIVQGQAEIWQQMFRFVDSMALKCVVELCIDDIIHSYGGLITLSQIASGIDFPSLDIPYFTRIMRLLVRKNIFTEHHHSVDDGGKTLYKLTEKSKWLLHDVELSLAPMVLMENHLWLLAPWHCLGQYCDEGDLGGIQRWLWLLGIIGGCWRWGTGELFAEIVKTHPHIKGINFDLPHVSTAPLHEGVSHVGGDMFDTIPNADAIFMMWVLHDWSDENCIKILKNCRKAIQQRSGKVIIVDIILEKDRNDLFDETRLAFDLLMMAHTTGGNERTELEWKKQLKEAGFGRYKIIKIPALQSIIEAYPD
ncbi:hypothetical protein FH972_014572 [Carpinus fangiana]|uniref:O-methyltransferase domain-containing protein n=1 Tax=Carpinus fangiana TaxID=176857 RepID=A0A5N6RAT1_9ROSI|nr:hypothetical protein FH972_014572 [Carpinus fangiana]